ncbi:MAG: rod shape-determining protein MreC [Cytophagaceae bacterium]|nr:rod shape-determining protein MreC [Cytophagaceae bacterium]
MQQIINFLIRYKHFLLFVFLLLLSLLFTIQSHSYHKSKFINSANFLSGGIYESVSGIQQYFNLKTYNQELLEENARLREMVRDQSPSVIELAAAEFDTLTALRSTIALSGNQFHFIPAKVLNNSYAKSDNFITLKAGLKDSVQREMGVITSKGIVGVIDHVSPNYSTVLSLLNTSFLTNAKLKNAEHFGTLQWGGRDPNRVQLLDVQQQAKIAVGDTIETSGRSAIFPKGIPIGTITSFKLEESKNFYIIEIQLFNDMTNIGHVYIIQNRDKPEIEQLEETRTSEE